MGLHCNLLPPSEIKLTKTPHLLVFSLNDAFLLTCHGDQGAILWDISRATSAQKLELEPTSDDAQPIVVAAAFTTAPEMKLVLTFGLDQPTQQFCVVESRGVPFTPKTSRYPNAKAVKSSPDGILLAFATDRAVEIRATCSGQLIRRLDLLRDAVVLAFSYDAEYLATADAQGKLKILEVGGDEVLESTLAKLLDGNVVSFRQCSFDTEPGWIPIDIAWAPPSPLNPTRQNFGVIVTSQRESSLGEQSYHVTRWYPRWETLHMPFTETFPNLETRYKHASLAPNATFFACITMDHDLVVRDTYLGAGYSVGLKGRVVACSFSTTGSRVAFACSNGRLGIWHVGQPQIGCQGG